MNLKSIGSKVILVSASGLAVAYGPAACGGKIASTTATPAAGSAAPPAAIIPSPRSFLPGPAFAHAGTGQNAVSIADIAEKAAPSVVNVASTRNAKQVDMNPLFNDPFFRHFFGPGGQEPGERRQDHGLGSGVIVSGDGLVLTNNHVIDGADEIKVTTSDKREFSVKVVGSDKKSDLAVLRLQGDVKSLTPIEFGDSSRLRLGDVVLAIGNPFAVGQTVTMGIVSAKGRANMGIAAYEDFIQTDAAINPGNSGGALVDMEGRLVGINTAILSRTGGSMGIGFAIPTNMAAPIMKALMDHGKVIRGWLGVGIQDIDQELAQAMHLTGTKGILISEVMDKGPGAKAGLKSGDVVLKLNGQEMQSTGHFRNAIAAAGTGATVKLDVLRDGKTMTVEAKLAELPEQGGKSMRGDSGGQPGFLDGLTLEDLNPAMRQKLDVPANVKSGVVVTQIAPGSPASDSGLRPGDVIIEVNKAPVADVGAFKQAYSKAKDRALLRVVRGGMSMFVVVKR
jgi:serine protease Do